MIKVLLINPPIRIYKKSMDLGTSIPVGLLSIASAIRKLCKVSILDCQIGDVKFKKERYSFLFGISLNDIKKKIGQLEPDIIGITIPYSAQSEIAQKICELCKTICPNCLVVFGGADPTVRYIRLIKNSDCDLCIIGEGELTFSELIRKCLKNRSWKNIPGIAFRKDNKIITNPVEFIKDLDKLPFPAYDLIDMPLYFKDLYLYKNRSKLGNKSISMITSRGCPYPCTFCAISLHMGKQFRFNSANYVIKHITYLYEEFGIRNFHFEDDNLTLMRTRFEEILDKIIEKKLDISWDTPNGVRADTLNRELIKKMKAAGCKQIVIAIESGNQHVLNKIIKKETSLKYVLKVVKWCSELDIPSQAFYVIGFPGEKIYQMKETLNLALHLFKKYKLYPILLIATPLYGTELHKICVENNYIDELSDRDYATATQAYGNPQIATNDFSKKDIKKLASYYLFELKKAQFINYVSNPIATLKKVIYNINNLLHYANKILPWN